MNKRELTEFARNNRFAMIAHGSDALIMCCLSIMQTITLGRAVWHIIAALVLGLAPVAGEIICWCRNRESTMIKHFVGYGYALFYTYFLFTAANNMFFLFVVPMIIVIAVYNDIAYSVKINVGVIIECVAAVIIGCKTGKLGYQGIASAAIQIITTVLITLYSCIASSVLNANNSRKLKNIRDAREQVEEVLENISRVSEETRKGIEDMNLHLEKLREASAGTRDNMEHVTLGIGDTTEAVQDQLLQTEAIQTRVDNTTEVADYIAESMNLTLSVIDTGRQDIEVLASQVDESVSNGTEVADKLNNLNEYIKEMNSIIELINGITSQTGLLALNASIEAARAGEAGRGFSVVATEISNMASQTKNATVSITQLISDISHSINEVVTVIRQMIEGINAEKTAAVNAVDSFENIRANTLSVRENISGLVNTVKELRDANLVIVDSVQRISGVSEEVYASATETMNAEENNVSIINSISEIMQSLLKLTDEN